MRASVVAAVVAAIVGFSSHTLAQASIRRSTAISAQPLAEALRTLMKEREFQIVYPSELLANRQTQGATGELTMDETLTQLLSGTGLTYRFLDEQTVTIVPLESRSHVVHGDDAPKDDTNTQGAQKPSFWDRFRVAQVDQGTAASNSSLEQNNESSPNTLEEVVVSARKRNENLQTTPIAVTAFSGAQIEARQATNVAEIARVVPNVSFDEGAALAGSSNTVTMFIRGVGQTDFSLTIDPGVGIYVDGVYVSRVIGGLLETADLEQVQVLRGPQGTLFGKNTIGGAVLLTTRPPSNEFEASLEATTGAYGRADVRGMVNVPLTDGFRLRASVSALDRRGYGQSLYDGQQFGNRHSLSGRLVGELDLATDTRLTVAADGSRSREHAPPVKVLALNEFGFFPLVYNNFVAGGLGCGQFPAAAGPLLPTPLNNRNCYNAQWLTSSPYTNYNGDRDDSDLDVWGVTATLNAPVGGARFKSITAYRDLNSNFALESDGAPMIVAATADDYTQSQFSQELQLAGTAAAERLTWLTGLYYLNEKGRDINSLLPGDPTLSFTSGGRIENDSYAAFTQLTYSLTERSRLTVGGRYTREQKRFTPGQFVDAISPAVSDFLYGLAPIFRDVNGTGGALAAGSLLLPSVEKSTSIHKFTPTMSLDYRPVDSTMLYASYGRGFKSGGFTQRVFPPLTQVPSFGPESLDSVEVGVKSELFERRLRVNATAFYSDYKDMQTLVTVFVAPTVQNAGRAKIKGSELELEAVPAPWLRFGVSAGYTDAKYTEISPAAAPITLASKLPNVPKLTGTASTTADVFDSERMKGSLRLDWAYKGSHFKDAVNTQRLRQGGYGLLNVIAKLATRDERWAVSAGVTNATNKKYLATGYADLGGAGNVYGVFSRPAEWFLNVRYRQ